MSPPLYTAMGRGRKSLYRDRVKNNRCYVKRDFPAPIGAMLPSPVICDDCHECIALNEPVYFIIKSPDLPENAIKIINRLFISMFNAGIYSARLPSSILAVEALSAAGYASEVVEGFQRQNAFASWHCWIEVMGKSIDIGGAVTKALIHRHRGIISPRAILTTKLPNYCERVDMDTREEVQTLVKNIRLLRLYQEKGAVDFWKTLDTSQTKESMLEIRSNMMVC